MKAYWTLAALVAVTACSAGGFVPSVCAQDLELMPISASQDSGVSTQKADDCDLYDACGKGDKCGCCDARLLGIIRQTDRCYSDFISPMTNPVFFEDPRNLTEIRFIFIHHEIPDAAFGGDAQLLAAQIRASLTERLSLIATKDGFIFSENPLLEDGWADVAVGLKYQLFADPCAQRLLSAGVTYEMPFGSTQSLQGNGDGEFHLYLTGGTQIGENWHWLSGTGFRLPVDTVDESQVWYWSNHLDCQLTDRFYVFGEANWYNWMKSGGGGVPNIEGTDLFNLGSQDVAGTNMVTGALGVKLVPNDSMEIGFAWETPMENRENIMKNRYTVDCIIRY
jgi:hypothetical protein